MTWEKIKRKLIGIAKCEIDHCLLSRTTKRRIKNASDRLNEVSKEIRDTEAKIDRLMATLDGEEKWFIEIKRQRKRSGNV